MSGLSSCALLSSHIQISIEVDSSPLVHDAFWAHCCDPEVIADEIKRKAEPCAAGKSTDSSRSCLERLGFSCRDDGRYENATVTAREVGPLIERVIFETKYLVKVTSESGVLGVLVSERNGEADNGEPSD